MMFLQAAIKILTFYLPGTVLKGCCILNPGSKIPLHSPLILSLCLFRAIKLIIIPVIHLQYVLCNIHEVLVFIVLNTFAFLY
jgi:hypothetical protein